MFEEVHGGPFGGHLRDAKIHGELSRQYWWPGMRRDIFRWCQACMVCASRQVGRAVRPPLTPIPVSGPFDRVGVDVLHFPKSTAGNQYAVVFVDYLTKWPEVFATTDQSALTITKLLVEEVVIRHGVPTQLLSDKGAAFLSQLMKGVCEVLGVKKINTMAYHPQTDGLVERYNRTLTRRWNETVQIGIATFLTRYLRIEPVFRSQLRSHLSFCSMVVIPDYLQPRLGCCIGMGGSGSRKLQGGAGVGVD